jgi:hypothetical protein
MSPDSSGESVEIENSVLANTRKLPDTLALDELLENIEKCPDCEDHRDTCDHHGDRLTGYLRAVSDMSRTFDLDKEDFRDAVNSGWSPDGE